MKKTKIILASVAMAASLTGCASTKNAGRADQNKSDCKFEFGTDVSARFTGTAYVRNLIPLDDTYNFPETNVVTLRQTHGVAGMFMAECMSSEWAELACIRRKEKTQSLSEKAM